ncbi:MAG: low-specificity L-threonine aldolase [Burkholderiales bacterium]|nr:low-specificity L-threonine aldolase [Burkholderiales bacterium]MBP9768321.1 low-specificity L-threonine aldolase [Burkholderiales bacterium]
MIDLRSDTVTKPSRGMLEAMMRAQVGDDVFGEDPTVKALEERLAGMSGMAAAVFAPTGTQSNLLGLLAHCGRGDEYIVGQSAHTYMWEGGGAAVLGSIQPQPLDFEADGSLDLNKVYLAIKPDDVHHARTKLLCLENTTGGKVLPLEYLQSIPSFCRENNLASHLDGARVFNAAVASNVSLDKISRNFDSLSICLSKGLGTPMGSVLCGSRELIKEARKWRKMLGGGMRQAGIVAAAGLYALDNNIERLADDHANAQQLATELAQIDGIELVAVNTNMLFIKVAHGYAELRETLFSQGIIFPKAANKAGLIRLATHLDVSHSDVLLVVTAIKQHYWLSGIKN